MKICLLSDHHISVNPRLWKEAFFYERSGHEVMILVKWQSKELRQKDMDILKGHNIQYKTYLNLIPGEVHSLKRWLFRALRRTGSDLQKFLKIGTRWSISHAPNLMFTAAVKENADLYVAHLECAFWVGRKLIKYGKKVAYDFEDWYSRDYLVPERPVKLLEKLEHFALHNGLFCTAASQSMTAALNTTYKPVKEITIIYNGFTVNKQVEPTSLQKKTSSPTKLLWFSRTIGPNRGIEYLLNALVVFKKPVELHLLGYMDEGYEHTLKSRFKNLQYHTLVLHPFMPHNQLENFISQFNLGLAIEENINDNKNLTISNKMLQYLQAGIPVLASNTEGQKEVASYFPNSVKIVEINNTQQWEEAIDLLCKIEGVKLEEQQHNFEKIFSWEAQEVKLNKLLKKYL